MTPLLPTASPRAAGSGSHDMAAANDMSWQRSEQGKRERVPNARPEALAVPKWQPAQQDNNEREATR